MANEQTLAGYNEKDLDYPLLMTGEDYFLVINDAANLTQCSITAFKKSIFQNALFIDASGAQFRVSSAQKSGYAPPFLGFRLTTARQITVALRFLEIRVLSLSEVIAIVNGAVNRSNWGADPGYLLNVTRSAETIRELFLNLAK